MQNKSIKKQTATTVLNNIIGIPDSLANFTVPETGKILKCSTNKVWELIRTRQIGFHRVGRRIVISKAHISQYLQGTEVFPIDAKSVTRKLLNGAK